MITDLVVCIPAAIKTTHCIGSEKSFLVDLIIFIILRTVSNGCYTAVVIHNPLLECVHLIPRLSELFKAIV